MNPPHECRSKPASLADVRIINREIQGQMPWMKPWFLVFASSQVSIEIRITHCPWCGNQLPGAEPLT